MRNEQKGWGFLELEFTKKENWFVGALARALRK